MTYNGRLNARMLSRDFPDADWRNILNIAVKWGKGDQQFTQDLIQSAVVKIYGIGTGRHRPLYTIAAKNAMRDLIRYQKRRSSVEHPLDFDREHFAASVGLSEPIRALCQSNPIETDESAMVDRMDNRLLISQALSMMDDDERTLVGAVSVGLEASEVAEMFGWSVPKTKSKLHRIQRKMRNLFWAPSL